MDDDPLFDRKLAAIFEAEAAEHLQRMHTCLAAEGAGALPPPERAEELFRAAHSLKGAARAVGHLVMEALCHDMETLLSAIRSGGARWDAATVASLRETVHALHNAQQRKPGAASKPGRRASAAARPAVADGAAPAAPTPAPVAAEATLAQLAATTVAPTVRLAVDRLDALLQQVEELVRLRHASAQHVGRLREFAQHLARQPGGDNSARSLRAGMLELRRAAERDHARLAAAADGLLAGIKHTLLVPVGSLRPLLEAAVRELARSQEKEVHLALEGGDVEMDRRLLDELREPLLHLVRNAVGHGIEGAQQRRAAGKPVAGQLRVAFEALSGGKARVTVADDGRGIDTAQLSRAAEGLGLPLSQETAPADLMSLVFTPGISTASQLTAIAGRGIGLPIVRDKVERLGGGIEVASVPQQGTTFTMVLPISMATVRAIEVRAGDQPWLLPTLQVERCLRYSPAAVDDGSGHASVKVGDQQVALLDLAQVLRLPRSAMAAPQRHASCVLLSAGERRIALAVDELRGEQEVLSKPVDDSLTTTPIVSGGALVATGETVAILNVAELVRSAFDDSRRAGAAPPAAAKARTHRILVAEDSITSRALLRNILQLAGYEVSVAVDGADALEKLRAGAFDLLVTDIEMPNLDGIGLTTALRAQERFARLPVVLVTSLAAPSDRERGAEAGANAYLVKSSFEQGDLLRTVRELL